MLGRLVIPVFCLLSLVKAQSGEYNSGESGETESFATNTGSPGSGEGGDAQYECANYASYCNYPEYAAQIAQLCPGLCSGGSGEGGNVACASYASYCNYPQYSAELAQACPGLCSGTPGQYGSGGGSSEQGNSGETPRAAAPAAPPAVTAPARAPAPAPAPTSKPSAPAPTTKPSAPAPISKPSAPAPTTKPPSVPAPTTKPPTAPAPTTKPPTAPPTAPAPTTKPPTAPAPTTQPPTKATPSEVDSFGVTAAAAVQAAKTSTRKNGFTAAEKRALVDMHNEDRRFEKAADMYKLFWDDDIAAHAQAYADKCPTGHSYAEGYGENLSWGTPDRGVYSAMQGWVEEERVGYNYNTGACTVEMCGHYTAAVWATTTRFGCGKRYGCPKWGDTIVCQFQPPGNIQGPDGVQQKPFRKGTPCSLCHGTCDDGLCIAKTTCDPGDLKVSGATGQDTQWNGLYFVAKTAGGKHNGKTMWESVSGNFVYWTGSSWALSFEANDNGYNAYEFSTASKPSKLKFLTGSKTTATVTAC